MYLGNIVLGRNVNALELLYAILAVTDPIKTNFKSNFMEPPLKGESNQGDIRSRKICPHHNCHYYFFKSIFSKFC